MFKDAFLYAKGETRGGLVVFSTKLDTLERTNGIAIKSLYEDCYPEISILDCIDGVSAILKYDNQGDTLASADCFTFEIYQDASEATIEGVISPSNTLQPKQGAWLKELLGIEDEVKSKDEKVKESALAKYEQGKIDHASQLGREARSNLWKGIEGLVNEVYPSTSGSTPSTVTKVVLKAENETLKVENDNLKATNEKTRINLLTFAIARGAKLEENASLEDITLALSTL